MLRWSIGIGAISWTSAAANSVLAAPATARVSSSPAGPAAISASIEAGSNCSERPRRVASADRSIVPPLSRRIPTRGFALVLDLNVTNLKLPGDVSSASDGVAIWVANIGASAAAASRISRRVELHPNVPQFLRSQRPLSHCGKDQEESPPQLRDRSHFDAAHRAVLLSHSCRQIEVTVDFVNSLSLAVFML